MRTTEHKFTECCYCGKEFNPSLYPIDHPIPKQGEIIICIRCAGVNVYDEKLDLVKPSKEIEDEILSDPKVMATLEKFKKTLAEVKSMCRGI